MYYYSQLMMVKCLAVKIIFCKRYNMIGCWTLPVCFCGHKQQQRLV